MGLELGLGFGLGLGLGFGLGFGFGFGVEEVGSDEGEVLGAVVEEEGGLVVEVVVVGLDCQRDLREVEEEEGGCFVVEGLREPPAILERVDGVAVRGVRM